MGIAQMNTGKKAGQRENSGGGIEGDGIMCSDVKRAAESLSDVKRAAISFSAVILSAVTLSACSGRAPLSGGEDAVHTPHARVEARTDEGSDPVTLRLVYSAGDLKWKSAIEDTAEAFMEENEDIEVELYSMPEIKNRTYIESLKILAAQKEFFDIVEMRETGTLADAGLLAPLPETVSSLVENPGVYDGVCYGVPRYATTLGIIYNKDIFESLGLSEPDTYEEFLQVCERVKAAGYHPLALGAADVWHMKFWGNYLFRNYMVSDDGEVQWTAKRTRQMLADYRKLGAEGYINQEYRNVSDSQTAQELSSERAAMVYTGPWMLSQIENLNPRISLGFFFLPGRDGITYAVQDSNAEWGISAVTARDGKKMEAAGRFLEFYYSEGIYETILVIMNADPVTVRPVRRPDTENQAIMEAAYAARPVRTGVVMDNVKAPDGFFTYFAQRLVDTLWGEESTSYLADDLTRKWEREAP